jgi:hypothetical protein
VEISSLPLPSFSGVLRASHHLCCMFLFSSLFIIRFFCFLFFCSAGGQSVRGLCWFIQGVAVGIPHATYLLTCWSAECLPSKFGAGVWQCRSPSCFLSVTWYGDTFYGLRVRTFDSS